MTPSEIAISAAQAGKTVQKLLKTGRYKARTTIKPKHPRSRSRWTQRDKLVWRMWIASKSRG